MNLANEIDFIRKALVEFPENEANAASLAEVRPIGAKMEILKDQLLTNALTKEQTILSLNNLKEELDALTTSVLPFVKIAAEDLLRLSQNVEESEV